MDPVELRARLSVAALLGGLWLFLLALPLAVAGVLFMPPVPVWGVFAALFVYLSTQGSELGTEAGRVVSFCVS